jgi:hypothetical protein
LCAEVLALKIRQNSKVKGFKIGNWEHKLDMYADDLTCYLDGSEASLQSTIDTLDKFQKISGLKINLGKCKAVWIGKNRFSKEKLCPNLKLIWSDTFSLLGLEFDSDLAKMDTNFKDKITVIEKLQKLAVQKPDSSWQNNCNKKYGFIPTQSCCAGVPPLRGRQS